MRRPPDPEMRSPGVTSARANRNSDKPGRLSKNENYAPRIGFASAVTRNAEMVLAVLPDGIVLGTFKSRLEAAQASGVRP
jgi:hypothetical protein